MKEASLDNSQPSQADVTRLLRAWQSGEMSARDDLMVLVYAKVRAIAAQSLRRNQADSLTPTDLAHEALIRLLASDASWEDRSHFYHVVAQATRQVLVDSARKRLASKRGGDLHRVTLDEHLPIAQSGEQLVQLDESLQQLSDENSRHAQIIELTYFGGFDRQQVADVLALSVATVDRDLRAARAWLKQSMAV